MRTFAATRPRRVLWHVLALALLGLVMYPLVWVAGAAVTPTHEIVGNTRLVPAQPVLDNFARALEGMAGIPVWRFLANSLLLAVLTVTGIVASSALAAYAFARLRFRGRNTMFVLMIGTLLMPFHAVIIPQYIIFQQLGLVDTYLPLVLGKFLATEAFFVFLMVQFMRQLPRELDQAARIDGCGYWGIFWHVIAPLSRPAFEIGRAHV